MAEEGQICPSCRSSKYTNPQLRFMVNTCGHSLCENCVEVLFARGSGLCAQCKTPIRKVNFRYQLFEDPLVQKEVDIRKKVLSDFNKREDDFDSTEEYDSYLEKIEEIIYNFMNDVDVEETKKYIEAYKRENKDQIKRNRLRPSASMVFYEAELEREALLREQREREDEEMMRDSRNGGDGNDAKKSGNQTGQSLNGNADSQLTRDPTPATAGLKRLVPPSAASALYVPPSLDPSRSRLTVPPSAQLGSTGFYAPVSAMPNMGRDRVFIPPPPSAVGGGSLAPPSMMPFAPPTASICSNAWSSGLHNVVTVPGGPPLQLQQQQQQFRPPDTVLIPTRSKTVRTNGQANADTGAFVYKPLELDLFGPRMPTESHVRWSDLVNTYVDTIIASIRGDRPRNLVKLSEDSGGHRNPDESAPPAKRIKSEEDIKPTVCGVGDASLRSTKPENLDNKMSLDDSFPSKKEEPPDSSTHVGLSEQLPQGACGIAPQVFLERCLQESRCALFI